MDWLAIMWTALLLIFIWIEAATVGLASLWFAVGALCALVADLLGAQLWLQVVLFFSVSVVLLLLLRRVAKKYFTPKLTKTNVDALIGETGKVTQKIDNDAAEGQIKLGAMEWTARSTNGDVIAAGTLIQVDKIEGVKAFVSPIKVCEKV